MGRFEFVGSDAMFLVPVDELNAMNGSILEAMDDPTKQKGPLAIGYGYYFHKL
jgi:hypothetical protein